MKLYHVDWCPDCQVVRRTLEEHGFAYEQEIVPDLRPLRQQVYDVSGQYYVPVLVDGERVLTETADIIAHLHSKVAPRQRDGADRRQDSIPPLDSSDERKV